MIKEIFDLTWVEHHLLYFALVGGIYILYLFIKILIKITRDIKKMDKKSKENLIKHMRATSKYNVKKEKKLTFNDKD